MMFRTLAAAFLAATCMMPVTLAAEEAPAPATPTTPAAPPAGEAPKPPPPIDQAAAAKVLAIQPGDIGMGDPNAPVKWIEYASAGCSHCAEMSLKTLPEVKKAYIDTGKVYYVLRDFPLDEPAVAASLLARCLPKEKFYTFMDTLFAEQAKWHAQGVDIIGTLIGYAKAAGMTDADIEACKANQALLTAMLDGRKQANEVLQVDSTPTHFLNGEKAQGAMPFDAFEPLIKAQLDKAQLDKAGVK